MKINGKLPEELQFLNTVVPAWVEVLKPEPDETKVNKGFGEAKTVIWIVLVEAFDPLLLLTVKEITWLVTTVLNNTETEGVDAFAGVEPGPKLHVYVAPPNVLVEVLVNTTVWPWHTVIEDPLYEGLVEKLATGVCEKALIDVNKESKNKNLSL